MDRGFTRVDAEFLALRGEINGRFKSVDRRFDAIKGRLDGMQRTMILGFAGIVASILGSAVAAVLATAI